MPELERSLGIVRRLARCLHRVKNQRIYKMDRRLTDREDPSRMRGLFPLLVRPSGCTPFSSLPLLFPPFSPAIDAASFFLGRPPPPAPAPHGRPPHQPLDGV